MLNCKQATQLMSERLDRPLTTKEKVLLGIHTAMCPGCRQFGSQMDSLRDMSKVYVNEEDKDKLEK